jgi:hypothetical protein
LPCVSRTPAAHEACSAATTGLAILLIKITSERTINNKQAKALTNLNKFLLSEFKPVLRYYSVINTTSKPKAALLYTLKIIISKQLK